jgi:hypothetical protein
MRVAIEGAVGMRGMAHLIVVIKKIQPRLARPVTLANAKLANFKQMDRKKVPEIAQFLPPIFIVSVQTV